MFILFETVYVILLRSNRTNEDEDVYHIFKTSEKKKKKYIAFPGPSPNPNPIPNSFPTHSLDHLANKLLQTTSTPYGLTNVVRDEI